MTCRAAYLTSDRPQPMNGRQALERINELVDLALQREEPSRAEMEVRLLEIQAIACLTAARERRREKDQVNA